MYTAVRPTERVEKVVCAIEQIFPGLIMDIRSDRIDAYDGMSEPRQIARHAPLATTKVEGLASGGRDDLEEEVAPDAEAEEEQP